jgi:hypothetical protein
MMGYRSDVTIGVAFPSMEALVTFITKIKLTGKMLPNEWQHYRTTTLGDDAALLHATFLDVKWYGGYNDVRSHIALYQQAIEDNHATAFVRIGGEDNDIEVEIADYDGGYDLWSYFGVRRELIAPEGGEPLTVGDN